MIKSYTHLEWYISTRNYNYLMYIIVPLVVDFKSLGLGWTCVGVSASSKQRNSQLSEMQGVTIKQTYFQG